MSKGTYSREAKREEMRRYREKHRKQYNKYQREYKRKIRGSVRTYTKRNACVNATNASETQCVKCNTTVDNLEKQQ